MKRRHFLNAATVLAAGGHVLASRAEAQGASGAEPQTFGPEMPDAKPFGFDHVAELAAERAAQDYVQPVSELVGSFADLSYDRYRGIRFRRDRDPWGNHDKFRLDLLGPGAIFNEPVRINVVREGVATPIGFDPAMLDFDPSQFPDGADLATVGDMGWSGFRLRTGLNRPGVMDEFLVFQGASYFRAVARGTIYGLSARGLAIRTGSPDGEEFPLFTDFWLHEPAEGQDWIRVHAVLDSRSVTGAYQFDITPGAQTLIRTRMALFPRVDLAGVGIAPLTSMFWFGPNSRRNVDDYRPAVHDSDGLQMRTGTGMALWRSLASHRALQIASFVDRDPQGFGLTQRSREFSTYQDAEALYNLRPSGWVEPEGNWGPGEVRLIEIPVENEFNDNIVSYWQPKEALSAGNRHEFRYRLTFSELPPVDAPLAEIRQTRAGRSINNSNARSFIIDYDLRLFTETLPEIQVSCSAGQILHAYLKRLPKEDVLRLAFEFQPGDAQLADLQASLRNKDGLPLSESWMTRWTA
ncbi:glucans biosynthesis protein [Paracoccus alcaliphilus]|uniref:Glucans biosynthesis protein n=1 Tax=Paracoccus alcaliphilus TaxID=34002 RepID=A0A1H8JSX2_9RHOB|nr:glucan biosynthesis protein G [Paracoccus alcaliphilus]WCR19424.1 glucan biosynthesis protein G [Paracoccus alcaliphilus]SEN83661.1 glucans biosynthesis protein [Paracoccus alcaliphilus]